MSITIHDLNDFHRVAVERVTTGDAESLWQLVKQWELTVHGTEQPGQDKAAVQAAVQAALQDMEHGDQGRSAREVIAELRSQLAQASDE